MRPLPDDLHERMEAAARVFATVGYEGARMEELADATQVSKTQLYYWFEGKQAILAHIVRCLLEKMALGVHEAVTAPGSAAERLGEVLRVHCRTIHEHPDAAVTALAEFSRAMQMNDLVEVLEASYFAPVRELLAAGTADGSLRAVGDAQAVASALYGCTASGAIGPLALHPGPDADPDVIADELIGLLVLGLGPR